MRSNYEPKQMDMQKILIGFALATCLTATAVQHNMKRTADIDPQTTSQAAADSGQQAADNTPAVDLKKKWGGVIKAIELVESEGKANAVSRDGRYVGCLQISQILVRECNQILGYKKFTYDDRYNREKSHELFIIYQEHFNREGNMERAIRLWNSGDLKCMQRKARTDGYYNRVMKRYNQLAKD